MIRFLITMLVILVIAAGIAVAGMTGSAVYAGIPVYIICVALAFAIQWLAFIPAFLGQTEKFYDLTGSLTYISLMILGLALVPGEGMLAPVMAACVMIWALRLGSFLFLRINKDGKDSRFEAIKPNAKRFLMTWSLQGLWVVVTAGAAIAVVTSRNDAGFGLVSVVGLVIWVVGFAVEIVADRQKSAFRAAPANNGRFINTGLWAWCRHPNYFGEILLWFGMAVMAVPALTGWQYVTLVSPVFVFLLLTRISGIPMLTAAAKKRWGQDAAWQAYMKNTPALLPRPPRRS